LGAGGEAAVAGWWGCGLELIAVREIGVAGRGDLIGIYGGCIKETFFSSI